MRPSNEFRQATLTCSLRFFYVMLALTFFLGLAVGIGAWIALAVLTLTALVSGGLVAPVFRYLAGHSWGLPLAALLGGVVGVVNLYAGTFLLSVPLAIASYPEYFDPANLSHWREMFVGQLLLTGIPDVPLLVFPATAAGVAFIWKRLRAPEPG